MTNDPRTVPAALDCLARRLPGHDALITEDRSFTGATLREEVHRAAAGLIALGVQAGDRVAIWSPNTWHWVVACLAIHHVGAAMVPVNTRYTAAEAADIVARTRTPVLFGMGPFLGQRPRRRPGPRRPARAAARRSDSDRSPGDWCRNLGRVHRRRR